MFSLAGKAILLGRLTKTTTVLLAVLLVVPWTSAQTSAPQTTQGTGTPAIVTNVDEVTLDLVVHDKSNKPVLNLQPGDIAVTDAGSPVKLSDLRLVSGSSGAHLITLVFDRLDPSGAKNAREIVTKILKLVPPKEFSIAVMSVHGRLRLLQEFTSDRGAVNNAIAAATAVANDGVDSAKADAAALPEKNLIAVAQTGNDPLGVRVSAEERSVGRTMLAALEESQRIVQDQHAMPSLAGLLALTRTQRQIAGRKVIFFFAQGLQLDSSAKDMLPIVVGTANRSSVSIYAVDANAIDADASEGMIAASAMGNLAAFNRANPAPTGPAAQTPQAFGPGMASQISDQIGRVESEGLNAYKNPLALLAANTGGAYIMATDNIKKPLQQMVGDMTTYYEASYVPPIQEYDGKFRPVAVQPLRKGLKIRSKPGYLAVPSSAAGAGLRPFEMPLMKILGEPQLPTDVKFRAGVLRLGELPDGNANTLVVEVPLSELEMHEDPNADLFSAHVSIVAQIKNKSGTVLEHFGEDVPRHGSLQSMEAARSDVITLQRHFIAGPGEYVLEVAVLDRNTGKASAQRTDFEIANPPAGPSLSDLALVRRTVPMNADADLMEPLRYESSRVVPDLSGRVSPEAKSVSLFFMIHSDAQASEPATLELEVLRNGESVGHMPLQLRKSAGLGAIPYLASIRAGALPAGNYQAVASLTQDGKTSERSVSFRVEGPELASAVAGADTAKLSSNDASPLADAKSESSGIGPMEGHDSHRLIITALPDAKNSPPTPDELQSMIAEARSRAIGYAAALPNFICVEVTDRSVDAGGNGKWRRRDTIAERVRYHDNAESRTTLEINGKRVGTGRSGLKGTLSQGEFGGVLNAVFQPSSKTDFQWKEIDALGGGTVQVLSYRIAHENSTWGLAGANNWKVYPTFHGLVYIDSATKGVRRITLEADDLPRDFSIHAASIVVDYDYLAIGTHDYLMPVRGTVSMRQGKREAVLNEMEFRNYRRYGSKVSIRYGGSTTH
ncbi:MAG TPA: VWA domain-containing protein [Candidatus Sulfotelmatobacter sp.]